MRSHAKAPTAGSTQRQAKGFGRTRFAPTAVLVVAIASLLAFAATPASASLLRNPESSFGAFSGEDPRAITVDQSNGDIYVVSTTGNKVSRFDSAGLPENFTCGTCSGNTLTGLGLQDYPSLDQVAIDNSGGPSDGNIYVTQSGAGQVKVFASSGEPLGTLNGSGTPAGSLGEDCGVAVDQANGDVYIASFSNRIWRYSPSGATVVEGDYSGGIATPFEPCQLAVAAGSLYAHNWKESPVVGFGPVRKYATSEFATGPPPSPSSTVLDSNASAVATDPSNGDVYVDEGNKVAVYGSNGSPKYSFGSSADFGSSSAGVAVRAGGSAYVSDPSANEVDVYGTTLEPGNRAGLFSFGAFSGEDPRAITVDQSNGDIYVVSTTGNKVSRFDSAGLPENFTCGTCSGNTLTGLGLQDYPSLDQVAIDNSGGPSDGNIYVTQSGAGQVKVFASSGEPLGTLNGSGTPAGSLGEDCGVAVDQANGDVYIASFSNRIWRYSPSGATVVEGDYSGGIATPFEPCQLAVAAGSLYAHNWKESPVVGFGPVRKYATSEFATGPPPSPSSTVLDSNASAVATDPSNGDVYVDEGNKVAVYGSNGSPKYSFGSSADFGSSSAGVAVRAGGNAYVSDPTNHQIDVYGPFSAPPPIVETKAVSGVKHTKATLHGHLDPNGGLPIVGCVFEWGTDTSYGEAPIACAEGTSFNAAADVSAELTGLVPGTTYHFRLHVTTAANGFDGEDRSFEAIAASAVPEVTTGEGSILSDTSTELKAMIDPSGNPLTACRFEYVNDLYFQLTGFSDLSSGGSVPCDQAPGSIPADFEDHPVTGTVSGLDPEQIYRFRLVAENANGPGNGSEAFIPGPPLVETMGSTYRTMTTARLDSRLVPHGAATTYHFEYGDQGPCDANPCTATEPHPAGSGNEFELVSQRLSGLTAATTYHYRLVADNGNPDGPAFGEDMTLTTRASDAPLTHGHFPGPPGSDRAWEQVNAPDIGGNPINYVSAISDNGDRVVYDVSGGSPDSEVGSFNNQLFAERTSSGWQTRRIYPTRTQAQGNSWNDPEGRSDLSRLVAVNRDGTSTGNVSAWLLSPDAPAQNVYSVPSASYSSFTAVSDDASRVISLLYGSVDPDHPVANPEGRNLYDVTSGTPHLISLLPDNSVPSCGVVFAEEGGLPAANQVSRSPHWVSTDGSRLVFPSRGNNCHGPDELYLRDLNAGQTTLISGSPVSGPSCDAHFIRSTADAAFLWTQSRLVAGDIDPGNCFQISQHGDIYRYGFDSHSLECVTCVVPGLDADVAGGGQAQGHVAIAVSDDGSHAYFEAGSRLLPGAPGSGLYDIDIASGDLAYVASDVYATGDAANNGNAINPDGSVYVFRSADPALNPLNGPQNGGGNQYYRYDAASRSLVCVSCPLDGSSPRGKVPGALVALHINGPGHAISDAGDFAFTTSTALVSADQNTAGPGRSPLIGEDVYEWRDDHPLLITDGLDATPDEPLSIPGPKVAGITPSGQDVFFTDPAQLTADAIDAYDRLYDARIGGGFDFPTPPPPCPLDACQGTPKGAPEEPHPGSLDFSGAGNQAGPQARCRKGKVRRSGRCVAKHQKKRAKRAQHRANHDRRASR